MDLTFKSSTIHYLRQVIIPNYFYFLVMHMYMPIPWLFIVFIANVGAHKGGVALSLNWSSIPSHWWLYFNAFFLFCFWFFLGWLFAWMCVHFLICQLSHKLFVCSLLLDPSFSLRCWFFTQGYVPPIKPLPFLSTNFFEFLSF